MEDPTTTPTTTTDGSAKLARIPWNKGKLVGAKPPLRPSHVWSIRTKLQIEGKKRDLALFNLAIDSKLRGCDLVHLRVEDVMQGDQVRTRALVSQRKTGAPVQFEVTEQARMAVAAWVRGKSLKGRDWLFPSRVDKTKPMTTRQYGRLLDEWIAEIGLAPSAYGTHSLRRTKAALIYRKTGNIRAVQLLLGHTMNPPGNPGGRFSRVTRRAPGAPERSSRPPRLRRAGCRRWGRASAGC